MTPAATTPAASGELVAPVAGDPGRAPAVRAMFARIAPGYDRANMWMSMGIDRAWRAIALRELGPAISGDVLDLCAGTLDFSAALRRSRSVTAVDFCPEMMEAGAAKAPWATLVTADARELPFPDASFDAAVAGFGLRNVPESERALAEVVRVLRPGGVLVVVDFFRPTTVWARAFSATYNRAVLPVVGGMMTGDASAYRYLAASMGAWMTRAEFDEACVAAGFSASVSWALFPPVVALVRATK